MEERGRGDVCCWDRRQFSPGLEGKRREQLRKRFILLASGEGGDGDIGE